MCASKYLLWVTTIVELELLKLTYFTVRSVRSTFTQTLYMSGKLIRGLCAC